MLYYSDGQPVQVGDLVDFDGEPGTVIEILEDAPQFFDAGMEEPAVGFSTASFNAIYHAPSDLGWDGVKLIRRKA